MDVVHRLNDPVWDHRTILVAIERELMGWLRVKNFVHFLHTGEKLDSLNYIEHYIEILNFTISFLCMYYSS